MAKIYSMASNDVVIPTYAAKKDGELSNANTIKQAIIVKGGANVADKVSGKTASFVTTEVTKEELGILKANPAFMRKVDRGFITIDKEPTVTKKDKSAQLTDKEVKAKAPKAKVSTGAVEE